MTRRLLLILAVTVLSACSSANAFAQLAEAGFAGNVSGGSTIVRFTDLDSLRTCLEASGNICVPAAPMTLAPGIKRLQMASNVTLDGNGILDMKCDSRCIGINGSNNIVRNVRLSGPGPTQTLWPDRFPDANCTQPTTPKNLLGCAVPILVRDAKQVIIEHNEFTLCGDKCLVLDSSDAVTVRSNKFSNSYFTILALGRDAAGPPAHATVTENIFNSVFRRSARASGAYVMHEFGNLFTGPCPRFRGEGFGPSAVTGAQALVENNVADTGSCSALNISDENNPKTAINRKTGGVRASGVMLARQNAGMEDRSDAVSFQIPYAYTRQDPEELRATILRNAGVRQR